MSSDDLTRDMADKEAVKPTQPMITEVFNLLSEVKLELQNINARLDDTNARLDSFNARLDSLDARIDQVEARLARDIEGLNTRMLEGFRELSNKIDALNRSRLQTEADYFGLLQRVTVLESKVS